MIVFLVLVGIAIVIGVIIIAAIETRRMDIEKAIVVEMKHTDIERTIREPKQKYAGLWVRFCAHVVDVFLITVVITILAPTFVAVTGWRLDFERIGRTSLTVGAVVFFFLCLWLYCALMQSSRKQATLGKMLGKIIITDVNGNRISFGRATSRFFIKMISLFLLGPFNFITVFFTEKRQALYDLIVGCLVLKKL